MRWQEGMRDRRTGERYPNNGPVDTWTIGGFMAIPDAIDPLTLALMKLQAVEEVCCIIEDTPGNPPIVGHVIANVRKAALRGKP